MNKLKNIPVAEQPESNEREKALALFKIDYGELVKKYGWDIGATLQVVSQDGVVQTRPQYVDIKQNGK